MNPNFNNNHQQRRRERRSQGRANEANRQTQQQIDTYNESLDQQTAIATRAIYLGKRYFHQYHETWNNSALEYRNPDVRQKMNLYFVLFGTCSVVFINLLLIKAPVEYIVKQSGASGGWQTAAAIAIPIVLLIFELYTGAQLQEARRQNDEDAERTWEAIGWFLILFTPLMILGTYVAGGMLDKPFNWILMITLMILAGGTDAAIVNGYDLIDMARAFAACQFSLARTKNKVLQQEEKFNKAKNTAIRVFGRLGRLYERHNNAYPQAQIPPLAFAHTTGWFVNYARGDEAITGLPPRPREVDFEFFDTLQWDQPLPRPCRRPPENLNDGMMGNPRPNPMPRDPQTVVIADNDDADDNENNAAAERDFYRDQLRRNAQQNEREVRP